MVSKTKLQNFGTKVKHYPPNPCSDANYESPNVITTTPLIDGEITTCNTHYKRYVQRTGQTSGGECYDICD